jgi:hypothetical protein
MTCNSPFGSQLVVVPDLAARSSLAVPAELIGALAAWHLAAAAVPPRCSPLAGQVPDSTALTGVRYGK